jgi:hypothetical protein
MIEPLDPFSEVVDEKRRWLPEWYSWLKQLTTLISAVPEPETSTALPLMTVAELPSAFGNEGVLIGITDSTINTWGDVVVGGGFYHVLVYSNGTDWLVTSADTRVPWFSVMADKINMLRYNDNYTIVSTTIQGWDKFHLSGGVVTPAATIAPDGTLTGTNIKEDGASDLHAVIQQISRGPKVPLIYRVALYAKQKERTRVAVYITDNGGQTCVTIFDLAGVQVGVANTAVGADMVAGPASIVPAAEGWCLCKMDFTYGGASAPFALWIMPDSGSGVGAASYNYAGDGASGIYLWKSSLLPAAAWNIGHRTFFDDFLSTDTIDMADSRAAGFNWYVHNAWPDNVSSVGTPWVSCVPTNSASISVSSSVLSMAYDSSGFSQVLNSVGFKGSSPGYVGHTFKPPMLWECSAKIDPAHAIGPGNPPGAAWAFWSAPIEFLTGLTGVSGRFVEWDITEAFPGVGSLGSSWTIHDWPGNQNIGGSMDAGRFGPQAIDFTQFHLYQGLWLTQAFNGGVYGWFMHFFDGVVISSGADVAYSATTLPSDPGFGGPIIGQWFPGEIQNFGMILGAGGNPGNPFPVQIDYVAVWQP